MTDNLKQRVDQVDKDLSHSWIELSSSVRTLAADLKLKAAGTAIAGDADHLSHETSRLCDHVERLHEEVIDLLENIESHLPLGDADSQFSSPADQELEKEKILIQRESHELRSDFKDILKALFMWKDDPKERVESKNS